MIMQKAMLHLFVLGQFDLCRWNPVIDIPMLLKVASLTHIYQGCFFDSRV